MKETIGHATSRKLLCGPTMEQTLSHLLDDRDYSWNSLVKGDEVSYLPNCQTNLVIALHAPSLLFWHFINTTAYDLGRYMPSSPVSCHAPRTTQELYFPHRKLKDIARLLFLCSLCKLPNPMGPIYFVLTFFYCNAKQHCYRLK